MLPRASQDLPGLSAPLVLKPGDLGCEEELLRQPGEGDHWWLKARVGGLSVRQMVSAIARAGDIPEEAVGFAGGRDRNAVVLQWLSVPKDLVEHPKRLGNAGYQRQLLIQEIREGRGPIGPKSVGMLRWRCHLRGAAVDEGFLRARAILDRLRQRGFPNYLTRSQAGGNQAKWGRLLAQGRGLPPRVQATGADPKRCLLTFRNQVFNRLVAARLDAGLLGTVLDGDVVEVHGNKPPPKRARELAEHGADYQPRCDSWEVVPLLPLFGRELMASAAAAREHELAMLTELEVAESAFDRLYGERRSLRIQPTSAQVELEKGDLVLTCRLPGEAHIEALLEEFARPGDEADA
jgi:tRNA pseudouridine13 synthase